MIVETKYGKRFILINQFVNYDKYCFFMSQLAHDYKRYGLCGIEELYKNKNLKGIYKRYYNAYMLYLKNKSKKDDIKCTTLKKVLTIDPIHMELFKISKDKTLIEEAINASIDEFLIHGITMDKVHEAVKY